jgi:alkylhydroperoxidase family enzyme
LASNGLTEADYNHVSEWATYPGYSTVERAALEFTENFALDHLAIGQDLLDVLRGELGDELTFELGVCVSSWLGLGRLTQIIGAEASCPLRI